MTAYQSLRSSRPDIRMSDLEPLATLGEGAFGLVRLVRHKQARGEGGYACEP